MQARTGQRTIWIYRYVTTIEIFMSKIKIAVYFCRKINNNQPTNKNPFN